MSRYNIESVLAATFAAIRQYGWTSQNKARQAEHLGNSIDSTSQHVLAMLCNRSHTQVTALDRELGMKAALWAECLTGSQLKNYFLSNAHDLAMRGYVSQDEIGILCAAARTWQCEQVKSQHQRKEQQKDAGLSW